MNNAIFAPIAMLTSCLVLFGCGLTPRTPEEYAKKIANDMAARGPEYLSGGARIASAQAKGDMLIVQMDRMDVRRDPLTYEQRSRNMQRMACNDFKDFLKAGGTVRMNGRMLNGHSLPPVIVKHCDPQRAPGDAP